MGLRDTLHLPPQKPCGTPDFTGEGEYQRGLAVLIGVYALWALLPIYWKQLTHIPPLEVLSHRSLWGFFLVSLLLWFRGGMGEVMDIVRNRRSLLFMIGCSFSHTFSWGFYIWAVGSGHILDAALGHYMQPIFSVLCGYIVFRERPRRVQWAAIALACTGVLGMVVMFGSFPWVGLTMALNSILFATLRKKAPVNAMSGLVLELLISAPLLWGYLAYLLITGQSAFMTMGFTQDLWLIGAGIVTIIPQMGYAYGLCRVPLTTISLLQYVPPTGNFLVGIFLFGEAFSPDKIFGFAFIWAGLIVFTLEGIMFRRSVRKTMNLETEPVLCLGPQTDPQISSQFGTEVCPETCPAPEQSATQETKGNNS